MNKLAFLLLLIIFTSCSIKEEDIEYGREDCTNCRMKIMDKKFGSEIVTSKGKVYKFDAVECMIRYKMKDLPENENAKLVLVTDYTLPGKFIDAKESYFLISKKIPSPMGAFLTSYHKKQTAQEFKKKFGGVVYNWKELVSKFSNGN